MSRLQPSYQTSLPYPHAWGTVPYMRTNQRLGEHRLQLINRSAREAACFWEPVTYDRLLESTSTHIPRVCPLIYHYWTSSAVTYLFFPPNLHFQYFLFIVCFRHIWQHVPSQGYSAGFFAWWVIFNLLLIQLGQNGFTNDLCTEQPSVYFNSCLMNLHIVFLWVFFKERCCVRSTLQNSYHLTATVCND